MDSYITRLARSNEKIKRLMRENQSSEKKCNKLKSKLKSLKMQVDTMCENKFETALRNQQLELRLKQAQMILQDDVDQMYGKNDITPLLTSKSLQ
jgi:predicted nuclease with TOPRIM domain